MSRDPRFDILFEPIQLGPVTAKNRFYQVPHCTGMGYALPRSLAALREVKAEGGWGVVCTEYCSIHRSSDDAPAYNATLWDDEDIRAQALMVEGVHRHGALAGVQLWYGGNGSPNLVSRTAPLGVGSMPVWPNHPIQTRAMDKQDIRDLRRWHSDAAKRACQADFDIVYIYATHQYLLDSFLSPDTNRRSDEYGGSLENRVRLVREIIEDTREAVGDRCALAVRFSSDDLGGRDDAICPGEQREMFEMIAELPDLWDINIYDWTLEAGTSRFVAEGALEGRVESLKQMTTKPVVGVGRFTSPDTMVRQLRTGILDMIGAARPSIADPFLPRKIEEGRVDDIRECIGCNICLSCHRQGVPIRCTQNPTMGEEWRRGWHPERIEPKRSDDAILVVGAGPAGLEAARALGQRGYPITLAEATSDLGGRVSRESRLPGLAEWTRVRDYRLAQIESMPNVEIFRESRIDINQILEFGSPHVVIATGSFWRRDGVGRWYTEPFTGHDHPRVFTPDDIMDGIVPEGPVVVFDDDHYYMGGLVAEKLRRDGLEVALVTPAGTASAWTLYTVEQSRVQARLLDLGIVLYTSKVVNGFDGESVDILCTYTERANRVAAASLVSVTARTPNDELYYALDAEAEALRQAGIRSLTPIGDCYAPGTIAMAIYGGHEFAREFDVDDAEDTTPLRERPRV